MLVRPTIVEVHDGYLLVQPAASMDLAPGRSVLNQDEAVADH